MSDIPNIAPDTADKGSTMPHTALDVHAATILMIDDQLANMRVVLDQLAASGFRVLVAHKGEIGIQTAQRARPDLILLDVVMPDMDGFEICRRLKATESTCEIPVIFMTALDDTADKVAGFEVGGVDYVTKPMQVDEVMARVRTHVALRKLQQQLAAQNEQLRQAHAELAHKSADLQVANAALAQYAYAVSHDLQAPLRAIHNYADFLAEDLATTLTGDQQAYLTGLGRAVREAEDLVRDLLALSQVGHQRAATEAIDLGVFLWTLVGSLDLPADVMIAWGDDWPTLEAEPILLRQIFQNLILNAIKFNQATPKRVELGWRPAGSEQVELYVRDNGIGIAAQQQQEIFQVFRRLHTQAEYAGTGIGLAIVQKAASTLQGAVRVESQPGAGSTFFVTLPRQREGG